jgi:hypothetical protein
MTETIRGGGRPKGYYLEDGTRVPGVTTILDRYKNSRGLIIWANNVGREGLTLDEARQSAVDVGSLVHAKIEAEINFTDPPEVDVDFEERVESAFSAWLNWWEATKVGVVATELPLISEAHRFGGTLDCVIRDKNGRLALADWKSSNAVYGEYLTQMAAYGVLWNETQEEKLTGGYHLVRIAKEHGDLEHRHFPNLDDAEELFLTLRRAYELDKAVAKRAK